ncbi:homoserine O-acetyltransferase [Rarobacter faecitabidus]|uniref:Homoserine O-acetyltransferase n=1 Tax=Rarobacter faecitabidus TaxID=13243 RepID=A0A542ZTI3_RARFA|nr:homoserine O-acetyltransferase [Rarobacter faecitabidus]TQL63664.1 homoserine O-acetyltransferase [Rarobacter faecitabidus]
MLPATGAWLEGDPIGHRSFAELGPLALESGLSLPSVSVAYETWGQLNRDGSNAVLLLHALTGDSHATGDAGEGHVTAGWWDQMVGPGRPIDTDKYYVVAPNVLGGCQGTTGPASLDLAGRRWGSRFPRITVRDQVAAEIALSHALGISRWHFVVGGSMGGLRALEWALLGPAEGISVDAIGAIACSAQFTGDQIAWSHPQLAAIRADVNFHGGDYYDQPPGKGPHVGLGIARQIAHITYRSALELDERFARLPQGAEEPLHGGRFAVQSYLDHHAHKLAARFDANSYISLTESMLSHDLGRERGGVRSALRSIAARALIVGVDSDRLFPVIHSERMAAEIPNADPVHIIHSDFGHDGFLIDFDQLEPAVRHFLASLDAAANIT